MRRTHIRRAFRDANMRDLYDEALRLGWTGKVGGSGHVILHSPDGQATLILSITAIGGRAYPNNRSRLMRWQKEQESKCST